MRLVRTIACVVLVAARMLAPREAAADDEPPTAEARQRASALFTRGEALYSAGDYAGAAAHFERAYSLAPHPDILWNAARSYERAGENARAANAYEDYLAVSAASAPDRRSALRALERLSKKLGRIQVHPEGATIFVDDIHVSRSERYVTPGSHAVRVVVDGHERQQIVEVDAGMTRSVSALPAPPPPPPSGPATDLTPRSAPDVAGSPPTSRSAASPASTAAAGWSPLVFVAGASLTAVAAGVAIGFGVDTLNQRSRFDRAPSRGVFDEGRDKQTRTNAAIGAAAGLAALTAVTGIWLIDWKGQRGAKSVAVAVSPTFVGVSGGFD